MTMSEHCCWCSAYHRYQVHCEAAFRAGKMDVIKQADGAWDRGYRAGLEAAAQICQAEKLKWPTHGAGGIRRNGAHDLERRVRALARGEAEAATPHHLIIGSDDD